MRRYRASCPPHSTLPPCPMREPLTAANLAEKVANAALIVQTVHGGEWADYARIHAEDLRPGTLAQFERGPHQWRVQDAYAGESYTVAYLIELVAAKAEADRAALYERLGIARG